VFPAKADDRPPRGSAVERARAAADDLPEEDDDVGNRIEPRPRMVAMPPHGVPDRRRPGGPRLGDLPLARRDVERLQQVIGLQRRLHDLTTSPRAQRAMAHRSIFREALTWLEIHGGVPETVDHWKTMLAERPASEAPPEEGGDFAPMRRRRRRRRRRHRPLA
jgi:hypothetical protein